MTVNFDIRLREDITGEAGEVLENNLVNLGSSFFLEVLGGDVRPEAIGLMSTLFEINYDPAILNSLDDFDSIESPLLTAKFSAVRTGNLDQERGFITRFGGGSLPGLGVGEAVGVGELESIALFEFQVIDTPSTQFNLSIFLSQTNFADGTDIDPNNLNSLEQPLIINTLPSEITLNNLIALPEDFDTTEEREIATVTAFDPDENDPLSFAVVGGRDKDDFRIEGEQLILEAGVNLDFETQEELEVEIAVTDRGGSVSQLFTIPIADVDELPPRIELDNQTIPEDTDTRNPFPVGNLIAIDPEGETLSYQVTGGEDSDLFFVEDSTLFLISGIDLDAENDPNLNLEITATDDEGDSLSEIFNLTVTEANEPPDAIALSNQEIPENSITPLTVGILSATDPDANDSVNFSITGGDDADKFDLVENQLIIVAGVNLDQETQEILDVEITATDRLGESLTEGFEIRVTDENEPPSAIALSNQEIPENTNTNEGAFVGSISGIDPEGDTLNFSIVGGENEDQFEIRNNDLFITSSVTLNHEQQSELEVEISGRDAEGESRSELFFIQVTDINEPPTAPELEKSLFGIREDTSLNTPILVGTLSATDPEGETVTFSVSDGEDENLFLVSEDRLFVFLREEIDRQENSTLNLEITASDPQGLRETQSFIYPTIGLELSNLTIPENFDKTQPVATISAIDEGFEDSFFYDIIGGADGNQFLVQGNELFLNPDFDLDRETQSNLELEIRGNSQTGNPLTKVLNLTVTDINEPPRLLELEAEEIIENTDTNRGLFVGTLSATDPEGETVSFQTVGGRNRNVLFVEGNRLFLVRGYNLDFETEPSLEVEIRGSDPSGNSTRRVFEIPVTDVDETENEPTLEVNLPVTLEQQEVSEEIATDSEENLITAGLNQDNQVFDELLSFTLSKVSEGEPVQVTISLPEGEQVNSYFFFDPQQQRWFEFVQSDNNSATTGGQFQDTDDDGINETIILTLVDGGFGDLDGEVNGTITNTGNAVFIPDGGQFTLSQKGIFSAIAPRNETVNVRHQVTGRNSSQETLEIGFTRLDSQATLPVTPRDKLNAIEQGVSLFSIYPNTFNNGEAGQFNRFNLNDLERIISFPSSSNIAYYLIRGNTLTSDTLNRNNIQEVEFGFFDTDETENELILQSEAVTFTAEITRSESVPLGANLQAEKGLEVFDFSDVSNNITARVSFDLISAASFNNIIGFYAVDDVTGRIDNIFPTDRNYQQALLQRVQKTEDGSDILLKRDTQEGFTFQLEASKIIVPFLISNGGDLTNVSNQVSLEDLNLYTPFLGANPDRADHFRILADNTFGIEDLPQGGDRDFNDMIFQLEFF